MPVDVMSGDESDHRRGERRYIVKTLEWRNPAISSWLLTFDALHLSTRFNTTNTSKRGNFPVHRIRNTNRPAVASEAVPGLPSNFYNKRWLETLDQFEHMALSMKPPINLSFSPYIQR